MAGPNRLKIFYAALAAIAVIGVGWLLLTRARGGGSQVTTEAPPPVDAGAFPGYTMGSDSAPITIVEYADFECPACGQYAVLTEPDVRKHLVDSGVVRVVYHDFPLVKIHANSKPAHMAAQCAGEQGKFWQMHDQLYFNQGRWALERRPEGTIRGLANAIGLDMGRYDQCMSSGRYWARLERMAEEAENRGISSTPTFEINGRRIEAFQTYDEMRALVDQALAKVK
jgi:protein-disulfide isomerase